MSLLDTISLKFWRNVDIGDDVDCWPWKGARNKRGYGRYRALKKMLLAHRVAWGLMNGGHLPPKDMLVCHSCDNPCCCNPSHLWLGTHEDNLRDSVEKGRRRMHPAHCINGHEMTPENTYVRANGWRECRKCNRAQCAQWRESRRARLTISREGSDQ